MNIRKDKLITHSQTVQFKYLLYTINIQYNNIVKHKWCKLQHYEETISELLEWE